MRRGFTLIELLAVIVILAVLALITVPIVNNILSKSKDETKEVSVRNYIRAVEQGLLLYEMEEDTLPKGTYNITTNGKICINNGCTNLINIDIDGEKPSGGSIEIENNKVISVSNLKYSKYYGHYKNDKITISKEIKQKSCTLADTDGDKFADVGEMITCGNERFYTVENNTTTISMLTEKNIILNGIETGFGYDYSRQSDNAGTIAFSNTTYWWNEATGEVSDEYKHLVEGLDIYVYDDHSHLYSYVEAYENYLKNIGVSSADATLMSFTQYNNFYNTFNNFNKTRFWLGTAVLDEIYYYYVYSVRVVEGYADGDMYGSSNGIRPIVTISADELG